MANFDLSKLMEGKNPQAVMLAETRQLKSKWEKTGLLEGLKERDQHQMSVLLENQAKQCQVGKHRIPKNMCLNKTYIKY